MSLFTYAKALDFFDAENHPRGAVFGGFGEKQKKAAIAHAKRVLSRALSGNIEDKEVDVADYAFRPDYAVFEQALWMLENGVIANGEQSAPAFVASNPEADDDVRDSQKRILAPEALRWLGVSGNCVVTIKG